MCRVETNYIGMCQTQATLAVEPLPPCRVFPDSTMDSDKENAPDTGPELSTDGDSRIPNGVGPPEYAPAVPRAGSVSTRALGATTGVQGKSAISEPSTPVRKGVLFTADPVPSVDLAASEAPNRLEATASSISASRGMTAAESPSSSTPVTPSRKGVGFAADRAGPGEAPDPPTGSEVASGPVSSESRRVSKSESQADDTEADKQKELEKATGKSFKFMKPMRGKTARSILERARESGVSITAKSLGDMVNSSQTDADSSPHMTQDPSRESTQQGSTQQDDCDPKEIEAVSPPRTPSCKLET